MSTQVEKIAKELAEIDRVIELSRTQPEAVAKIDALEGEFRQALASRSRWHLDAIHARAQEDELRNALRKLPEAIEARDLAFERIDHFSRDFSAGLIASFCRYDEQTDALRVLNASAEDRLRAAKMKTERANIYFESADSLAATLADQINGLKADLRNLLKLDSYRQLDAGAENREVSWLKSKATVPAL